MSVFENILRQIPNKESGFLHIYGLYFLIQQASQKQEIPLTEIQGLLGFDTFRSFETFQTEDRHLQGGSLVSSLFQNYISKCVFEAQCNVIDTISANVVLLILAVIGIQSQNSQVVQVLLRKVRKWIMVYLVLVLLFSLAGSAISESTQSVTEISRIGYSRETLFGFPYTRLCGPSEYSVDVITNVIDQEPLGIQNGCDVRKVGLSQNLSFLQNSFQTIVRETFDITNSLSFLQARLSQMARNTSESSNGLISAEDASKLLTLATTDPLASEAQKLKNINEMFEFLSALSSISLLTLSSILLYVQPGLLTLQETFQKKTLGIQVPEKQIQNTLNSVGTSLSTLVVGYNVVESLKTKTLNVVQDTLKISLQSYFERFSVVNFVLKVQNDPVLNDGLWIPIRGASFVFFVIVYSYLTVVVLQSFDQRALLKIESEKSKADANVAKAVANVQVEQDTTKIEQDTTKIEQVIANFAAEATARSNQSRARATSRPRAATRARSVSKLNK